MAKKVGITDTILRDAHQSQAATRMRTEEMLPACEVLDSMGYWSLECWGGATFDSCLRFRIRSCRCFSGGRIYSAIKTMRTT